MPVPRVAALVVVDSNALTAVTPSVPGIVLPPSATSRLTKHTPPATMCLAVHSRTRQFASVLASEVLPAPRLPTIITRGGGTSSSACDRSIGCCAEKDEGRARRRRRASARWRLSQEEKVDSDAT